MGPPVTLGKLSAYLPLTVEARQPTISLPCGLHSVPIPMLKVCWPQKYRVEYHHNRLRITSASKYNNPWKDSLHPV